MPVEPGQTLLHYRSVDVSTVDTNLLVSQAITSEDTGSVTITVGDSNGGDTTERTFTLSNVAGVTRIVGSGIGAGARRVDER